MAYFVMDNYSPLGRSIFIKNKEISFKEKHSQKKLLRLKKSFKTSKWETLFIFTLVSLILAQGSVFAKKSRKLQKLNQECKFKVSDWTRCSKPCDMGVSTRELIARSRPLLHASKCKTKTEIRLCMVSPCDEARFKPPVKGRSRCLRMFRSKTKEHLEYAGGVSEKSFKMRYCGVCEDRKKCCTPSKSKTKKVRFKREDGTNFYKQVAFIRKCKCHRKCPTSRPAFNIPLHGDMHREEEEERISVQKQINAITGSRFKSVVETTKR